jgi:hypothetical protein
MKKQGRSDSHCQPVHTGHERTLRRGESPEKTQDRLAERTFGSHAGKIAMSFPAQNEPGLPRNTQAPIPSSWSALSSASASTVYMRW